MQRGACRSVSSCIINVFFLFQLVYLNCGSLLFIYNLILTNFISLYISTLLTTDTMFDLAIQSTFLHYSKLNMTIIIILLV